MDSVIFFSLMSITLSFLKILCLEFYPYAILRHIFFLFYCSVFYRHNAKFIILNAYCHSPVPSVQLALIKLRGLEVHHQLRY